MHYLDIPTFLRNVGNCLAPNQTTDPPNSSIANTGWQQLSSVPGRALSSTWRCQRLDLGPSACKACTVQQAMPFSHLQSPICIGSRFSFHVKAKFLALMGGTIYLKACERRKLPYTEPNYWSTQVSIVCSGSPGFHTSSFSQPNAMG